MVSYFILATIQEKSEATCWAVRNTDTWNRRSPLDARALCSSFTTVSVSTFMPLSCPMLNLVSRYCHCSSLKWYAFFAYFNAYPSGHFTGDSVVEELVAVIVSNELSPSWIITAYFNFARSTRVSLSIALVHIPNAMCFFSEECLWKSWVQPSLGHKILAYQLHYCLCLLDLMQRLKKPLFVLLVEPPP